MANWNLSVDLRGNGGSLARTLRESAQHAASLARTAKDAKRDVVLLGNAARTAATGLRLLARDAELAARHVGTLGTAARTAHRQLTTVGAGARDAHRQLSLLGTSSQQTTRNLTRMAGQMDGAIRDLTRLAAAARTASTHMGRIGASGERTMGRFASAASRARSQLGSMAALLSGGGLLLGAGALVKNGAELQQSLNTFGAVSNATAMQMARASATANQLGNDLTLPGASAIEAAHAMVELSKAGFRTDQAISATRASLLLSAAAQTNAADSAKYLGDMMDQFGMSADQAGTAADTLAATANAASGGVTDIYYAMKYAGPVAHGLGVNMQDAASGVGMLAKAGILGSTAGTTLRGMLTNLSKPTAQMKEGLQALGVEAWDTQGRFKGLRYVIGQLETAQHKLTQQDFTAAAAKAFGKPALSGAVALAHQGVQSYDALSIAVRQQGSAAAIAAAQGKGLAGAMVQLKTQSKQTGLAIYQGMSPGLEYITRGLTEAMSSATPRITAFFQYLNSAAQLFGPDLKAGLGNIFGDIGNEASKLAGPLKAIAASGAADVLHILLSTGQALLDVLRNLAHGAEPIVHALGDLAGQSDGAANSIDLLIMVLDHALSILASLSGVLVPIGHVVGGLVSAFGALPGPVQSAVFAMLLFRRVQGPLTGLATTVSGRVTGAFRNLGAQMAVQRTLATTAGMSLSRYAAAFAVIETRIPVIGSMASAFRTASAAGTGFTGALRGVTAAAGAGLRGAMSGLVGALGGPWGAAIAAGTVVLGLLASAQQRAAAAAAQHKADVDGLTQALRQSNGASTEAVRESAAQAIQNAKLKNTQQSLTAVLGKAGFTLRDATDAYLGHGASITDLTTKLDALADQELKAVDASKRGSDEQKKHVDQWLAYGSASAALKGMAGDAATAAKNAKDLTDATKGASTGITAYDRLKNAVAGLADKTGDADSRTRALKDALDLLSGGSLNLQAAEAKVNEAVTNANEAMQAGIDHANGWGKQLVQVNGTLSTVTKNGQDLFNTLGNISEGATSAAVAAFQFAQSQNKSVPDSLKAARTEMEKARQSAIDLSVGYGLTKDQAAKVADSLGLIPGQVSILLQTSGVDSTLAELLAVQAQLAGTPNAKTITVEALSADAKQKLIDLGFQIEMIPGTRQFKVTVPTAGPKAAIDSIQSYINTLEGKTVTNHVVTEYSFTGDSGKVNLTGFSAGRHANGAIADYYADGGIQRGGVRHFAGGAENHIAQIAPAGSWRIWGEPETQGEAYIPLAIGKRARSKAIAEETVRRLGGKKIEWNANGNVTDWRYDPTTGSLYSPSDAGQAGHKTRKVKGKDVDYFDLGAVERKLTSSAAAARRWNADLTKVANRTGADVANALAAMGQDGVALTHKMATGTTKYVNQMAASLRDLAKTARASLVDYTRQLAAATKTNAAFEANLLKLAGMGYGDLASQLAAQGDTAAQQLAADAVHDRRKANNANAAAKRANDALTPDQVAELVQIIASVSSNKVGIHLVAERTGLGEDEIVTVLGKSTGQVKSALGSRASKLLADLARAQRGLSFADGGIRAGMYATAGGVVRFAEPSTGGEAYIPLGGNKRAAATGVLHDVAGRFGLGLTPAHATGRQAIVIRDASPAIGNLTIPVTRSGATATDIAYQVGRQVRRARRGGVQARV